MVTNISGSSWNLFYSSFMGVGVNNPGELDHTGPVWMAGHFPLNAETATSKKHSFFSFSSFALYWFWALPPRRSAAFCRSGRLMLITGLMGFFKKRGGGHIIWIQTESLPILCFPVTIFFSIIYSFWPDKEVARSSSWDTLTERPPPPSRLVIFSNLSSMCLAPFW